MDEEIRNIIEDIKRSLESIFYQSALNDYDANLEYIHSNATDIHINVNRIIDILDNMEEDDYEEDNDDVKSGIFRDNKTYENVWHSIKKEQPYFNGYYLLKMQNGYITVGKKIKKGKYVTGWNGKEKDVSNNVVKWALLPKNNEE